MLRKIIFDLTTMQRCKHEKNKMMEEQKVFAPEGKIYSQL